jgi:hypothetical protein
MMAAPTSQVLCAPWAATADLPAAYQALVTPNQLLQASEILWGLSGRRWYGGGCMETALMRATPPMSGTRAWPYHSSWGHCPCWTSTWTGRHYSPVAIKLPREKATVTEVRFNGVVFTDWEINRSGWIERTDGKSWQLCDDSTEIDYTFGEPPPMTGKLAAVALAIELYLDGIGSTECRLPQRVTSVTRQGVSQEFKDTTDFLAKGGTGIHAVDLFLGTFNPKGRGQRGSVWSPDIPSAMRIQP